MLVFQQDNPSCLLGQRMSAKVAQRCHESAVRHLHTSASGAGSMLAAGKL